MQYVTFAAQCRFTTPARTGNYKGSALRGMFGRSLRRICCALKRRECGDCLLAANCVYNYLFESLPRIRTGDRPPVSVHPYVLSPRANADRDFAVGDTLTFHITLFGERAISCFPHVVCCLTEMGKMGFGRRESRFPGTFSLLRVTRGEEVLYNGEGELLPPEAEDLSVPATGNDVGGIKVDFLTPLRIKWRNRFVDRPEFHLLVRAALRRISELEELFGPGEPDLDYRGLVAAAEAVLSDLSGCRWQEINRYSSRQNQKMKIGGVVGNAVYRGDLAPFLPLFEYCRHTHLGKLTAFGLGRFAYRVLE